MAKLGMVAPSAQAEEDVPEELKIFYCSRTHSQLTQFVNELRRVKLPPPILPDPEATNEVSSQVQAPSGELKQLSLGSRKNLCIYSKVAKLNSVTSINERCLDLQQPSTPVEKKCPHLPNKDNQPLVNDFRDHALARIRDIEDLGRLGEKIGICPYYASRAAIKPSEVCSPKVMGSIDR